MSRPSGIGEFWSTGTDGEEVGSSHHEKKKRAASSAALPGKTIVGYSA
jgi:hypothetical protein